MAISKQNSCLSPIEKERITTLRVRTEDMAQFVEMPYSLNHQVKYFDEVNGHPFAYMDLDDHNKSVAKKELAMVADLVASAHSISKHIPRGFEVPVNDVVYTPSKLYGYTRLLCTPHTFTGRVSKYPLSLLFTTDPSKKARQTHGQLFYGKGGKIEKAEIFCWRGKIGCFFYLASTSGILAITKVETNDRSGTIKTVYSQKA